MKKALSPLKIAFAALLLVALAPSANAVIIASYIDGNTTSGVNLTPTSGITATSLTSSGIPFGTVTSISRDGETVITPAGPTAGSSAGSQWLNARNNQVATGNNPVSTDDFYSFTVTADSGDLPQLLSLTFDMVTAAAASNGGITTTYQLYAAADGGAFAAVGAPGNAVDPGSPDLFPGGQTSSIGAVITPIIDLTGLAPANSYEFRIALSDNSGAGVKTTWLQGIQLSAVPEPSAALLGGLGLLALLLRRRR